MTSTSDKRSNPSLAERLAGGVWGQLVGDALGVPYEFKPGVPADTVEWRGGGIHNQPPGTWSDDGALMLALLDSLLTKGFDTTDQAQRNVDWYRDGKYAVAKKRFDIGATTEASILRFMAGTPAEESGGGESELGNGSLMRILPLALVEREIPTDQLVDHAHRASKVTHGAHLAQVCCALYVLVARGLVSGRRRRRSVLADAQIELRGLYESKPEYLAALDEIEAWQGRSGRGHVVDSFWSAWDAFQTADSYESAVKHAVAYGNDTDTTAAIAGGLAGLRSGVDGIPPKWRKGLRDPEIVCALADELVDRSKTKYRIYVIELKEKVWRRKDMKKRNPSSRSDKPCVYVGYSSHTPEERFEQHMNGEHDSPKVRDFGVKLRPRLYENAPVAYSDGEAQGIEERWAARLRRKGFGVWEGRLGPIQIDATEDSNDG